MKVTDFKGKPIILLYKDLENEYLSKDPILIDEIQGFGIYVDYGEGVKEAIAYSSLIGWKVVENKKRAMKDINIKEKI